MTITIIVLIVTIAMFVWGRVRGDVVALSALMVLTATGVLTTSDEDRMPELAAMLMMMGIIMATVPVLLTKAPMNEVARTT